MGIKYWKIKKLLYMDYKAADDVQYIEDSIPSMVLQRLLRPDLPQKTTPFFSVFYSSPPPSYSTVL